MHTLDAIALKKKMLSDPKLIVVNVLSQEQFQKLRIPGSINIPLEMLKEKVADALPDKGAEIVVYCSDKNCSVSSQAMAALRSMGYTRVTHFAEGLAGWEHAGFTLEGSEAKHPAAAGAL